MVFSLGIILNALEYMPCPVQAFVFRVKSATMPDSWQKVYTKHMEAQHG